MLHRILIFAVVLSGCSSSPTRATAIAASDLDTLRATFNEGSGPRAIVFFSSACHACDEGSQLLDRMLDELPGDVTVFAVWEPIASTDKAPPAAWLDNIDDRRVHQLWDPTHVISKELRRAELAHPTSPAQAKWRTDKDADGIMFDTVVIFPKGARWEATMPAPIFVEGGLARILPEVKRTLSSL